MPDLSTELDDLLNSFAEADRPAMREMLTRNPSAASVLSSHATVYDAFVGGDQAAIARATAAATTPPVATSTSATTTPSAATQTNPVALGLDQITALLNERVNSIYTSPQFATAVDALAEKKAKAMFESERASVIGRSAEISDTIAAIHGTHLREFNEPLDSAAFKTYYAAEGPKYGNDLLGTYNAFVAKKREDKRVADGIAAGLAAQATAAVPGSAVPGVGNPMAPNFVDFNVHKIDPNATVVPSADADRAAQAFASMRGDGRSRSRLTRRKRKNLLFRFG
jgi:hypothetical protein